MIDHLLAMLLTIYYVMIAPFMLIANAYRNILHLLRVSDDDYQEYIDSLNYNDKNSY